MEKYLKKIEDFIENRWNNIKISDIIFTLITVILSIMLLYCFAVKKEGYNADEVWSYGYANSYYSRSLNTQSYVNDTDSVIFNNNIEYKYKDINEWVDAKKIHDYLVVNEGEEFAYDSVIYNHIDDTSPPLYTFILHTICSFFPEIYSRWFAFLINFISSILTFVFLYKLVSLLKSDKFALICCVFYGLSLGYIDDFVYLRMYGLQTALLMVALYNICSFVKNKKCISSIIIAIIICLCGFLTSYYFISMIGLVTFFLCVFLLFTKKIKKMLCLGFSMLFSLILSFCIYPNILNPIITRLSNNSNKTDNFGNYNFKFRVEIIANMFLNREFGISVPYYSSGNFRLVMGILAFIIFISIPLMYLFRDGLAKKIKDFCIKCFAFIRGLLRNMDWIMFSLFVSFVIQSIVIGETCMLGSMGSYAVRYLWFIFPVGVIICLSLIFDIIKHVFGKNITHAKIVFLMLVLVCIFNNMINVNKGSLFYFQRNTEGETIKEAVDDGYIIYIDNLPWHLMEIAPEFINSKQYFQTVEHSYSEYIDDYKSKLNDGKIILIIDKSQYIIIDDNVEGVNMTGEEYYEQTEKLKERYDKIIDTFEDIEPNSKMKKVSSETYFGDVMEAYIVNP